MTKITPDSTIGETVNKYPETAPILQKYFHGACLGCPAAQQETLEQGAAAHGLTDLKPIMAELQAVIDKSRCQT